MRDAKRYVLALAAEDRYGLYEVLGELGAHFPALAGEPLRELASRAISELVDEGDIVVLHRRRYTEDPTPVSRERIDRLLGEAASWLAPHGGGPETFVDVTPTGLDASRKLQGRLSRREPRGARPPEERC
jgi:hypothetical protein